MSNSKFYLIDYKSQAAFPYEFISGEFNVDEWEWDEFDPNADKSDIQKKYSFSITDKNIKKPLPDFLGFPHNIVSARFLELCDKLAVNYLAVPVEINMVNGEKYENGFFIFTPLNAAEILDQNRSVYSEDKDLATGEIIFNKYHPTTPMYSWIKEFSTKDSVDEDFFICIELMKWACSESFKAQAEESLAGFEFISIDDNFCYDPWGELA